MAETENPAFKAFLEQLDDEFVLAQVVIRISEGAFELRHVEDRGVSDDQLRLVAWNELRPLAQFTSTGYFRPLKSAPNLQRGWRVLISDTRQLERAIDQLYPGAIADWHAARSESPPITHYRACVERQTGMYRITAKLDDDLAGRMIRACCHVDFCLKRRMWTVPGLAAETFDSNGDIPCLEPCAVLLEFARKAMRIEQERDIATNLKSSEIETLLAALEDAALHPEVSLREADFGAAANPRRIRMLREKLQHLPQTGRKPSEEV